MGSLMKLIQSNFNVKPLVEKIEGLPHLWEENTWRQNYKIKTSREIAPQEDTQAIMFRWASQNKIESVRDSLSVENHKNIFDVDEVQPLIAEALENCEATECGRVFIAKLKSGGKILPHMDHGVYADHFERFHLVLTSEEGNKFFVMDGFGWCESRHMKPGQLFWFNHKETHWAVNESKVPRMHLIIDCVAPKYRRERARVSA